MKFLIFAPMKKKTIWTIAIIMGFSFLALLYLQLSYIQEMVNMKKEQFDESVNRALYQASRNLELNETLRTLRRSLFHPGRNSRICIFIKKRISRSPTYPFYIFENLFPVTEIFNPR